MLQPNLTTSPAMLAMLAACVLGIGFLIRVFVALAGESGAIPVRHKIRPLEIRAERRSRLTLRPMLRWEFSGSRPLSPRIQAVNAFATSDRSNVVHVRGFRATARFREPSAVMD